LITISLDFIIELIAMVDFLLTFGVEDNCIVLIVLNHHKHRMWKYRNKGRKLMYSKPLKKALNIVGY